MGKRSNFKRIKRDLYPTTDPAAVIPLLPFLEQGLAYAEICAGGGALIKLLDSYRPDLRCAYACDIKPTAAAIEKKNALHVTPADLAGAKVIITNPPWDRDLLHQLIPHFTRLAPTWLLFDADWMHTVQSVPHMPYCRRIVSVGRVRWFQETETSGKDNCAWYQFLNTPTDTQFIGRGARDVEKE